MAPLASDPRQLLVVLNVARRKALHQLVTEIAAYMRSELELPQEPEASDSSTTNWDDVYNAQLGSDIHMWDAPLFHQPPRKGSTGEGRSEFDEKDAQEAAEKAKAASQTRQPPSAELRALRKEALLHFDGWRKPVLVKLKEVLSASDTSEVLDGRKKRGEMIAEQRAAGEKKGAGVEGKETNLIELGAGETDDSHALESEEDKARRGVVALQKLYHPIPTRLTTIPVEDRREVVSAVLVLLLSMGNYSAYSRVLVVYLVSALELPPSFLTNEETEIAMSLVDASTKAEQKAMSGDAEAAQRKKDNQSSRYWKVGLASVAGAAVIGITGGLAAPVIAGALGGLMGTVGLGSLASFLGVFWMNGALVGTLFGAFGANMTGKMMDQYAKEVEDFGFIPLKEEWGKDFRSTEAEAGEHSDKSKSNDHHDPQRRLRVTIGINGWLASRDDVTKPWRCLGTETEVFALRYEMDALLSLGNSLENMVASYAWGYVKAEIIRRTVFATLWAAMWPLQLLRLASKLDNPFSLALNRSDRAGKILADALINRAQGERPVTLVGYSLGARVVYICLRELAARKAFGLIDSAILIGAPIPSNRAHFQTLRSVVSGRIFNIYSENDYLLAFMYRATSLQLGIAGLQAIQDVEGVENLDLSKAVKGHLRYPKLTAKILRRCGFEGTIGGDGDIEDEVDETEAELEKLKLKDIEKKEELLFDFEDAKAAQGPEPIQIKSSGRPARPVPLVAESEPLIKPRRLSAGQKRKSADARQSESLKLASGLDSPPPMPPRPASKTASPPKSTATAAREEISDGEDEYGPPVQMMDNDDGDEHLGEMTTYDAPLPIGE